MENDNRATAEPVGQPAPEDRNLALVGQTEWLLSDIETDRYIKGADAFRKIEIRLTKPEDWVLFGKTLHLQDKRLAELTTYLQSLAGLNVTILKPEMTKETFKGYRTIKEKGETKQVEIDVIEYICRGGVRIEEVKQIPGKVRRIRVIEPITGSCNSNDKFFSRRNGEFLDPAHIQPSLIQKKAEANYRGNCMRYIWGLKGLSLQDLKDAGFTDDQIGRIHKGIEDNQPMGTPEERDATAALWKRIVQAHGNQVEPARKWLQEVTSFKSFVNKHTGETVPDFNGYNDINRVKPGSKSMQKVMDALAKLEKNHDAAAEGTQQQENEQAETGAALFTKLKKYLEACTTTDAVIAMEKKIAQTKGLNTAQMKALSTIASNKVDAINAETGGM